MAHAGGVRSSGRGGCTSSRRSLTRAFAGDATQGCYTILYLEALLTQMNTAFFRIMRTPSLFSLDISRHLAGHRIYRGLGLHGGGCGWPVQVHEYGVHSPQNVLLLGSSRLVRQVHIFG